MISIDKTQEIPQSLLKAGKAGKGSYNDSDVIEQLIEDSGNKCYICELKNLTDPEVEHLLPHENGKYPDRKYDWNNIFWSCRHCNSVKNQGKYYGKIIDCTKENPEIHIHQAVDDKGVHVEALDQDSNSVMTAELIEECFNLKNHGIRMAGANIRTKKLQTVMNALYKEIMSYRTTESALAKRKIQAMTTKKAEFAGFTRAYLHKQCSEVEYKDLCEC